MHIPPEEAIRIVRDAFASAIRVGRRDLTLPEPHPDLVRLALFSINIQIRGILQRSRLIGLNEEVPILEMQLQQHLRDLLNLIRNGILYENGKMPPDMPIPEPVASVDQAIKKSIALFETISKMSALEADIFFSYIWDNMGVVDSHDGQLERIVNYRFRSGDFRNAFELSLAILVKLQAMPPEPTIHILSLERLVVQEMARFWGELRPRKSINTSRNHGSLHAFCMVLSEELKLDMNPDKVRSGIFKYLESLEKSAQESPPANEQYAGLLPSAEEIIRRLAYPDDSRIKGHHLKS